MENRELRGSCALDVRVYLVLADEQARREFTQQAEREEITYCDGVKASARPCEDIMALDHDGTINFVGFVGHLAFAAAKTIGREPLLRIDHQKYRNGDEDLLYREA